MEEEKRKQAEIGLRMTNIFAGTIQVIEAFCIVALTISALAVQFKALIETVPELAFILHGINYIANLGVIVVAFMFADLMKWLLYSSLIHYKDNEKDAEIGYGIALLACGRIFYAIEKEATYSIGHNNFSIKEDKKKYTDNENYNLRLTEKQKIQSEWDKRSKDLQSQKKDCADCKTIAANYDNQIASLQSKVRTPEDRAWIQPKINNLASHKVAEVLAAKAQREKYIQDMYDQEQADYRARMGTANASITNITSTIDTGYIKNGEDIKEREKKIAFYSWGFSLFTLLIQALMRFWRFRLLIKLNILHEVWDENNLVLDGLQRLPKIGKYFEDNYWQSKFKNFTQKKESNAIIYQESSMWNTSLSIKRQAKYQTFIKEKEVPDNLLNQLWFFFSGKKTIPDEDLLNRMNLAYSTNKREAKRQNVLQEPPQEVENKIEENNENFQENIAEIQENNIILNEQGDDFILDIENVINILNGLKDLYDQEDFAEIQNVINILENLKNI